MGCDIHPHLEVKLNGRWEHYSCPNFGRNYELFGVMAGVRDTFVTPIVSPKGAPSDMSMITKHEHLKMGNDGHTHSWFNKHELNVLHQYVYSRIRTNDDDEPDPNGDFNEYYWDLAWEINPRHYIGPDSYRYEDIRLVFWFDS